MPSQQVVYIFWRDIPAQFIVGKGRQAKKVKLPDRFEKAIDKCAMKLNFTDTDSYLKEWRKTSPVLCEGSLEDIINNENKRFEIDYNNKKLNELIENGGIS